MADYQANVKVNIDGLEKLTEAERKILELNGKEINVKVKADESAAVAGAKKVAQSAGNAYYNDLVKSIDRAEQYRVNAEKATTEKTRDNWNKKYNDELKSFQKGLQTAARNGLSGNELRKLTDRFKNAKIAADDKIFAAQQRNIEKQARALEAETKAQARLSQKNQERAIAESNKQFDREQKQLARNAMSRKNALDAAARTMNENSSQARALRDKSNGVSKEIDDILKSDRLSGSAAKDIQNAREAQEKSSAEKDFINQQKNDYKATTEQSKQYAKALKDVYGNYQKLNTAAARAKDGSAEQQYLKQQADWFKNQYDAAKASPEYDNLSDAQKQSMEYMEYAGAYQTRAAYAQKQAGVQAKVTSQQYKDLYNQQKHIYDLENEQAKYSSSSDRYDDYQQAIDKNKQMFGDMKQAYGEMDAYEKARLDSLNREQDIRKENFDLANQLDKRDSSIASNNLKARLDANSKMKKAYADEIDQLQGKYDNAKTYSDLRDAQKDEQALFARAQAENNTGMTFIDRIKSNFANFGSSIAGQFLSAFAAARAITSVAKGMYSNVAQMDAAMTELYKVTNNSQREYQEYSRGVQQTSMELGATQTSLVKSTATFARLGYNLNNSAKLGANAVLFSNVGDDGMTSEEAAEDMVAIMKGFNIQAEDSLHIVDSLNKVGKLVA